MKLDTLGRRRRTASQPTGRGIQLTPGVLRVLDALRRHPVLPTPLLFPYWCDDKRSYYYSFQKVMERLFHETKGGGPYVLRPKELNPDPDEDDYFQPEPMWYELSEAGKAVAQADYRYPPPPHIDHYYHRAMGSCIGASFELLAKDHGLDYISFDNILQDNRCPKETGVLRNPLMLDVGGRKLEPDGVFGLRIVGKGKRWYCREDDRGGERFNRVIGEKLERYIKLFENRTFERTYGLPNPRVMFISTGAGRSASIMDWLKGKPYADRFLFKTIKRFNTRHWRVPRKPLAELYEPWDTINGQFDLTA